MINSETFSAKFFLNFFVNVNRFGQIFMALGIFQVYLVFDKKIKLLMQQKLLLRKFSFVPMAKMEHKQFIHLES